MTKTLLPKLLTVCNVSQLRCSAKHFTQESSTLIILLSVFVCPILCRRVPLLSDRILAPRLQPCPVDKTPCQPPTTPNH